MKLLVLEAYRNDFGEVKEETLLGSHELAAQIDAIPIMRKDYGISEPSFCPVLASSGKELLTHVASSERIAGPDHRCEEISVKEVRFVFDEEPKSPTFSENGNVKSGAVSGKAGWDFSQLMGQCHQPGKNIDCDFDSFTEDAILVAKPWTRSDRTILGAEVCQERWSSFATREIHD
jgi:hypothetical protein